VIVITLNEESVLGATLRAARTADEIVVVDGGSTDETVVIARGEKVRTVRSSPGRGRQLRTGIEAATGDVIVMLHADTILPRGFREQILELLESGRADWGRFDIRFDGGGLLLRLIARLICIRSRLTHIATGDQAIFVRTEVLHASGGIREDVLFEDIDLCRRLKQIGVMGVPTSPVITSARRWRKSGTWSTTLRMWSLRVLYLAGWRSDSLARYYPHVR
jgi:rSAM/selenodomain-associated transferase 2